MLLLLIALISCDDNKNVDSKNPSNQTSIANTTLAEDNRNITLEVVAVTTPIPSEIINQFIEDIKSIEKQENKIIALVNTEKIFYHDFLDYKALYEFSYNEGLNARKDDSQELKQKYIDDYQKTDDQLIDVIIRNYVVKNEAIKSGITVTNSEALEAAKQEMADLKEHANDKYEITLKAYEMSEEDYIKNIKTKNAMLSLYIKKYNKWFYEKNPAVEYKVLENHVDNLVASANIIKY